MYYEEGITPPRWIRLAVISGMLFIIVAVVLTAFFGDLSLTGAIIYYISLAIAFVLFFIMLRTFNNLRIQLSDDALRFGFGGLSKSISTDKILSCTVSNLGAMADFRGPKRYFVLRSRIWDVAGVRQGVLLEVDEEGQQRQYFLSSARPQILADYIRERLAGAGAAAKTTGSPN